MNIDSVNIQIMWKEIAIIFFVVYISRFLIDLYMLSIYKKINSDFYLYKWDGLENKIRKHLKLFNIFSNGPWNKKICLMYNGLCIALASIALLKSDDVTFVNQLQAIKKEDEFEMKPFILSLYYYSKQEEVAQKYYNTYLKCNQKNENIRFIMGYLFDEKRNLKKEELKDAVKTFQNPAIIKLFEDNNIL